MVNIRKIDLSGFVSIKEASSILGVPNARVRYFLGQNSFTTKKDATGHIFIKKSELDTFVPEIRKRGRPTNGITTEKQVIPTNVSVMKRAIRLTKSLVEDSDDKTSTLNVLNELLAYFVAEWQEQEDDNGD